MAEPTGNTFMDAAQAAGDKVVAGFDAIMTELVNKGGILKVMSAVKDGAVNVTTVVRSNLPDFSVSSGNGKLEEPGRPKTERQLYLEKDAAETARQHQVFVEKFGVKQYGGQDQALHTRGVDPAELNARAQHDAGRMLSAMGVTTTESLTPFDLSSPNTPGHAQPSQNQELVPTR